MSKIIDLQYNLSNGENIQYIHIDEYVAVRRNNNQYIIHSQVRYGAELETHLIEAIIEQETAQKIEHLQINTIGSNQDKTYPLNLSDFIDVPFTSLENLIIPPQTYGEKTYIYDGFNENKENGVISKILAGCPKLINLTLPCYPDTKFRNVKLKELETLKILDNGCADKFLKTLGKTPKKNLPKLHTIQLLNNVNSETLDAFMDTPIGKNLAYLFIE